MNKITSAFVITTLLLTGLKPLVGAPLGEHKESQHTFITQHPYTPYLVPVNEIIDLENEPETPFRRAEIIFFISYPFILAAHFAIFAGLTMLSNPNSSLSLNQFSPEITTWMFASSAMTSGVIAWADYERRRLEKLQNPQRPKETSFQLQFSHRF